MKFLKKILIYSAPLFLALVLAGITGTIWCYRRFCDLDSRFYSPSAEAVLRLRILRSFDPPLSFTVIRTKAGTTLQACVLPIPHHFTFSYITYSLRDQEWKEVIDLVEKIDIPSVAHTRQPIVYLDGSDWYITIARGGRIEKAFVRCPDSTQDDARYASLVALGKMLNERADFITAAERMAIPKRDSANQAAQSTTTAVTPPAGQEAR